MNVRDSWIAYIKKERAGFDTIFAKDIFSDWAELREPGKRAERCLDYALELRYGQDTTGLSEKFLDRCLLIVERILVEQRFYAGFLHNDGPTMARGDVLEARTFANALLGNGFDIAALCEAASDFVSWALHERWDDQSEDAYLHAVRLLLVAGDVTKASELIKIRKKFKWHGEQAEVLRRVVRHNVQPIDDHPLLESFDAVFGPLRPRYPIGQKAFTDTSKTRFELGVIRDKYFVSPNGEIDWNRTIDGISS